jgi:hypothetical protein
VPWTHVRKNRVDHRGTRVSRKAPGRGALRRDRVTGRASGIGQRCCAFDDNRGVEELNVKIRMSHGSFSKLHKIT